MANEIDELMALDPLLMSSGDIDGIIAYHRRNRANAEAGIKPKKETGPKVSLDNLMATLITPKPTAAPMKRRV